MYGAEVGSGVVRKTANFGLPLGRRRDKSYKVASGETVYTCFTSDFWVEEADAWRPEAWAMIRGRPDLTFVIFTKRIHRLEVGLPADWGDGYPNVVVGCTVENQAMADYRLPLFGRAPIRHKLIVCAPLLERIDLSAWLDGSIEEVSAGGESGPEARVCDYEWVLDIRRQCVERRIPFSFHQTGAKLLKDGRLYRIRRCFQHSQARKAGIDYGPVRRG